MEVSQIVLASAGIVFGGGTLTAVILWIRFKSKDKADTGKVIADSGKTGAEARKIDTETIADGFKKLYDQQASALDKKIIELAEMERVLRENKDSLLELRIGFEEKEKAYKSIIMDLTTKVHNLEAEIKTIKNG